MDADQGRALSGTAAASDDAAAGLHHGQRITSREPRRR